MSWKSQPNKKLYDGSTLVPISVAKEILEIREEIEKGVNHSGANLELVYEAYKEINLAHGHDTPKLSPTCSGCTQQMNKKLKNWLKLYDRGTVIDRSKVGIVSKPLKPIKTTVSEKKAAKEGTVEGETKAKPSKEKDTATKSNEPSYAELLKRFEKEAPKEVQDTINNGKKPKKVQIIEYFNKK